MGKVLEGRSLKRLPECPRLKAISKLSLKNSEPTYRGGHGDRLETEMMLLAKPSNVKMEKAIDHLPEWPDDVETLSDYSKIMKFCVEGFPSFAKPESAKRQYKRVLSSIINDLTIHYEI